MNTYTRDFDVIVVGGGHAGIEAAYAAAKMGSKTLMITLDPHKIGLMPCNPAIGGIGKGHIVYEISALGGLMPKLCTQTYLQARMLNTKKGSAVHGLRLQIDKFAYNELSSKILHATPNLTIVAGMVEHLIVENGVIRGAITRDGSDYKASTVILTTGTFLNGLIHIGPVNYPAGRRDEEAVPGLTPLLKKLGIQMGRLKTGTPPRLLRESLDFSKMKVQEADNLDYLFEFYPHRVTNTRDCYITQTNARTHEIIKKNLHLSAMYSGNIHGIGPRYCPSIEDKIARFGDKEGHHVFVEPEGASSDEIYPNGISTSLPYEVQKAYVQTIAGFENAVITKPGYAIEYDFVLPHQLTHSLEVKKVEGLFLAGQINGTTGYEEAAGQGIIAGINAHLKAHNRPPFIMTRSQGYIGVMIDDLVTLSVDEPYRMFTSRAESRLLLRQDNAFLRLTERAYALGLIEESLYQDFKQEKNLIEQTLQDLRTGHKHAELLRLFGDIECNTQELRAHIAKPISESALKTIHAEIKYEPYIQREQHEIEKLEHYRSLNLPETLDFKNIPGLSKELQEKLLRHKPSTIAQASLISGMTPAALSLLIFKTREYTKNKGTMIRILIYISLTLTHSSFYCMPRPERYAKKTVSITPTEQASQTVTITNNITPKMMGYTYFFITYQPTTFTVTVNNTVLENTTTMTLNLKKGTPLEIVYYCEFENGRKSSRKFIYQVPLTTSHIDITFNWHSDPRIQIKSSQAVLQSVEVIPV